MLPQSAPACEFRRFCNAFRSVSAGHLPPGIVSSLPALVLERSRMIDVCKVSQCFRKEVIRTLRRQQAGTEMRKYLSNFPETRQVADPTIQPADEFRRPSQCFRNNPEGPKVAAEARMGLRVSKLL